MKPWLIGRWFGIGVFVHWSFLLLLAYVLYVTLNAGASVGQALNQVVFVLAIFVCVVLHEYGHALTARRFGIQTRDIVILPLGGVARLERMPTRPLAEFVIAIAGPLVNVAIVLALLLARLIVHGAADLSAVNRILSAPFIDRLMYVNIALVIFNMIPAFPMDGGRVLRSILAATMDYLTATRVATIVGQVFAAVFFVVGLFWGGFILMLIAVFVFFGARAEYISALARARQDARYRDRVTPAS